MCLYVCVPAILASKTKTTIGSSIYFVCVCVKIFKRCIALTLAHVWCFTKSVHLNNVVSWILVLWYSKDFYRKQTFSNGLCVCWRTTTPPPTTTNRTKRNEATKKLLQYSMKQHLSFMTMHLFVGGVDFFGARFYALIEISFSHRIIKLKHIYMCATFCWLIADSVWITFVWWWYKLILSEVVFSHAVCVISLIFNETFLLRTSFE